MAKVRTIPKNMKIISMPDGSVAMTPKSRSRRRYKMSKKQRDAIRRSRNKLKIPIVQGALVGAPIAIAIQNTMKSADKPREFGRQMLFQYTGYDTAVGKWAPAKAIGLWSTLGWFAGRRLGVFKEVNQFLGRNKVPLLRA